MFLGTVIGAEIFQTLIDSDLVDNSGRTLDIE